MADDIRFNFKASDLGRLPDLGALLHRRVFSDDPELGIRVHEFEFEKGTIYRTEYYAANEFMEFNRTQNNDTASERFGDTRKVASVPLHIWVQEIAPRFQDGNHQSLKKWLNDADNRPFRTFKGKV